MCSSYIQERAEGLELFNELIEFVDGESCRVLGDPIRNRHLHGRLETVVQNFKSVSTKEQGFPHEKQHFI